MFSWWWQVLRLHDHPLVIPVIYSNVPESVHNLRVPSACPLGFSSLMPERACLSLSGYLDVAERDMSGGKEEEEGIPDNKAVLRDALSSLDIRGRKAPATDEVCRKVFRPTALPSPTPAWCCAGPCDARLLGHAARSGHVGIDGRP